MSMSRIVYKDAVMIGSEIGGAIKATSVRYIKLGAGGRWENPSLDNGRIDWGLPSDPHNAAMAGKRLLR